MVIKVTDPSGGAIPGAEVWIGRASDSLKPFLFATDGGTLVADIKPGKYETDVQFPAFTAQKQQLTVLNSAEQHVKVVLQVFSCSQCVAVEKTPVPEPAAWLPSPSANEVPSECHGHMPYVGLPVFLKNDRGVLYGVSLPQNRIVSPSPVPLYIWIRNTNDQDVNPSDACDLIRNAGINLKSVQGREVGKREISQGSQLCSVHVPVRVPARTCFPFARVNLNDIYQLHSGVYGVLTGNKAGAGNRRTDPLLFQYQGLVPPH